MSVINWLHDPGAARRGTRRVESRDLALLHRGFLLFIDYMDVA